MKSRMNGYSLVALVAFVLGGASAADGQPASASKKPAELSATLRELRETRDALSAVTEFESALRPAEQIVAKLEGRDDLDFSNDLLRLANIQAGLEDYGAAEVTYLRAIEMLEDQQGAYSPALIAAYHALGRTYIDSRLFREALVALERAQWISKRNFGLFDLKQSGVIDDMTLAHLESGDAEDARDLQRERLDNAIKQFGPNSPKLIPFYHHLGDFYDRSGRRVDARTEFRKALEISSAHFGDSSPESLDTLRRLTAVQLHLNHRSHARDQLLAALDKATGIDPKERGLSLAVLGDWSLVTGDQAAANRYYSEAYIALRKSDDADADDFFGTPVMLDFVRPMDDLWRVTDFRPSSWGTIELSFDVLASGQASRVRMVSVEPSIDGIDRAYSRRIREAHFRPRLEEGRPVATSDVRYTHRFRHHGRD